MPELFRRSLASASENAINFFMSKTFVHDRSVFFARGKLGDDGSGAVYAYYDEHGKALYVGQSGRTIKSRMHDQTSPHKKTLWWETWKTMRFVQVRDCTDRLTLELLLILALQPAFNTKPGPRMLATMFENADGLKAPV
ncbi:GIY-YIG nuclease family protein [uncultured Comamonas sp.]